MRSIEPNQPISKSTEDRLRQEIEDLRQQLRDQKGLVDHSSDRMLAKPWHPSGLTIWSIFLCVAVLFVVAFFTGYLPQQRRRAVITSEAREQEQALPRVEVIEVGRSGANSELRLPGNIQAVTEAPILARTDGYIQRRLVDIGDRVKAGQTVAEIDAPELGQQVRQAKANLQQTQGALEQALASYNQSKANVELARVTAQRWGNLVAQGVVSKQENDQYQTQYQAQVANAQSLDKAIEAQRGNVAAAEANLARLDEVQNYRIVKAPFDGVITLRNVDVGALVNAGGTLLFRIAQTGTVRTYLNVPQSNASSIRLGQMARVSVSNLPGRSFTGTVARTANSLDSNSRTMLVEIQVQNADGALLPGMYAQVVLSSARAEGPISIPGDALIVRSDGTQVATVLLDGTVHLQKIVIGRDYGDRMEVVSGLKDGDRIIANPSDIANEGVKVEAVVRTEKVRTENVRADKSIPGKTNPGTDTKKD